VEGSAGATNLRIDPQLLERDLIVGGHRTKRGTANEVLTRYIQRREQFKGLDLFGTMDPADMASDEEMRAQRKRSRRGLWTARARQKQRADPTWRPPLPVLRVSWLESSSRRCPGARSGRR
jgi:uncharacterized pyridoxal phosphate-containing UPF0001 family protein